ncbi:MAG: SURF1 family protein [Betaproteobacteria bacterium]|nr:SURF1 family protein [Betaproteobacteria bacterium]
MRIGPLAFTWWTAAVSAALCTIGIALGDWQSGRAAEKREISERLAGYERVPAMQLDARPVAPENTVWRKVEAHGEFDAQRTLFLANRLYRGQSGYYVVTPLRIDDGDRYVLVLRGWLAARNAPPAIGASAGTRVVQGLAVPRAPRAYETGSAPPGDRVRQNIDLAAFEAESGLALHPFLIEQRGVSDEGLIQDWPARDALLEQHRIYAGQWYALAALSIVIFLVLSFRHGRRPADA